MDNEYTVKVSKQGRIKLPECITAKSPDGRLVASRGLGCFVQVYTYERWKELEERFIDLLKGSPATGAIRPLIASAQIVIPKGNYIVLPSHLREYANISEYAVIKENEKGAEIWGADDLDLPG